MKWEEKRHVYMILIKTKYWWLTNEVSTVVWFRFHIYSFILLLPSFYLYFIIWQISVTPFIDTINVVVLNLKSSSCTFVFLVKFSQSVCGVFHLLLHIFHVDIWPFSCSLVLVENFQFLYLFWLFKSKPVLGIGSRFWSAGDSSWRLVSLKKWFLFRLLSSYIYYWSWS